MNYEYATRKITRDFKLVEEDEICRLSGLPTRAGNERCQKCKNYGGKLYSWQYGYIADDDCTYIICRHQEQKDSENCQKALDYLYRKFEERALCALDG